jgi:hypothetical protein
VPALVRRNGDEPRADRRAEEKPENRDGSENAAIATIAFTTGTG